MPYQHSDIDLLKKYRAGDPSYTAMLVFHLDKIVAIFYTQNHLGISKKSGKNRGFPKETWHG